MRQLRPALPWLAVPGAAFAFTFLLPDTKVSVYVSVLFLLGTVFLAVPTIRINEQGRQLARIKPLIAFIQDQKVQLATLNPDSDEFLEMRTDIAEREERLREIEAELAGEKGQWTSAVHKCLYGGYGLVLGAMIVRLCFL